MIVFEIYQKPVVQKQTMISRGRWYNPSSKDQDTLRWQIQSYAPKDPFQGPVMVDLMFYMPMPKSSKIVTKNMINGTILPIKRPDIDNMAYIVTNAMKGIMYVDDSQIVDLILRKRYAEITRTVVRIVEL